MMEDNGFPQYRRLRKPALFAAVYQGNQTRVRGQYFTVLAFSRFGAVAKYDANDTISAALPASRVGVVASKKVSKLAVRRNRLKRLMRESFRQRHHPDGFDFVIIAKPSANHADNANLINELDKLWKKLHTRCATC